MIEGIKLIEEVLSHDSDRIDCIYCLEDAQIKSSGGAEIRIISQKDLERISSLKNPNQALAVIKQEKSHSIDFESDKMTLVLDQINDPGNLGTIIRTADWFGIKQIICSPDSVDCYNPKVIQSTMGSIFRIKIIYTELSPALSQFEENGFKLLSAEMEGENALEFQYPKKSLMIMGSESHGVSSELSEKCIKISIPKRGQTESLNVAMAAGIICAAYSRSAN